jgi:hypothetical protein
MISYNEFRAALKTVHLYKKQADNLYKKTVEDYGLGVIHTDITIDTKVFVTNISVRLLNILAGNKEKLGIELNNDTTISELQKISALKFSRCRGAGSKCLQELRDLCTYAGISIQP